jgi:hypothetical protein
MTPTPGTDAAPATFSATLELGGRTATGLPVPPEVVDALGSGRQPLVRVTLGSHTYRSRIGVRAGRAMIPVSAAHREAAGIAAGDRVRVVLELDTEPREVAVPLDLADALAAAAGARERFDALSPSRKRAYVDGVEGAKGPETRARRIAKAVRELAGGA